MQEKPKREKDVFTLTHDFCLTIIWSPHPFTPHAIVKKKFSSLPPSLHQRRFNVQDEFFK